MMILNDGLAFHDDHPPLHHLPGEEDIGGVVQHNLHSLIIDGEIRN